MPLVVGIDEAGYGPLLGPLVVAASVWQVPGEPLAASGDFWPALDGAVCREAVRRDGRLPVGDSKQVFDRKRGIATLERTVLAFATTAGMKCDTLGEFLVALGSAPNSDSPLLPWYQDLAHPLPIDPVRSSHVGAAEQLSRSMESSGIRCCGLLAEIVTEAAFNDRVQRTRNKAAVLLEQVLRLMQRATARNGCQDVFVHVDRLGGRQDYRAVLLAAFPDRHLHVEQVAEECSRYRLATQRDDWRVGFTVDADQHCLPVALASMVAKYTREALMRQFNAFWHGVLPTLDPTAGYYSDGQRFLADIRPVLGRAGLTPEQFVRQR